MVNPSYANWTWVGKLSLMVSCKPSWWLIWVKYTDGTPVNTAVSNASCKVKCDKCMGEGFYSEK